MAAGAVREERVGVGYGAVAGVYEVGPVGGKGAAAANAAQAANWLCC